MKNRSLVRKLAKEAEATSDPLQWFEKLYDKAGKEGISIPWDDGEANPNLVEFCERHHIRGEGRKALIIGCGFGHDAEYLASIGFQVTAFDLSPSAIGEAKKRFPNSPVNYRVEDLFNLPNPKIGAHPFVFESYTLQALARELVAKAIGVIASLVETDGQLLVITQSRNESEAVGDLPRPLTRTDVLQFENEGLQTLEFEDYTDDEDPPIRRFRILFQRTI